VPAVIVRAEEGEQIDAAGIGHRFKITGEQSQGRLGFETFTVPPATLGARPHIHRNHDEYFYVLSGRLTVATDRGPVELGPGDLAQALRGSLHGFSNGSEFEPVTALCLYTPPGYEQYFRDVHEAAAAGLDLTTDVLQQLRARYNTESF
jgi:quercetin dioxygenase-like cupin family protein